MAPGGSKDGHGRPVARMEETLSTNAPAPGTWLYRDVTYDNVIMYIKSTVYRCGSSLRGVLKFLL